MYSFEHELNNRNEFIAYNNEPYVVRNPISISRKKYGDKIGDEQLIKIKDDAFNDNILFLL